ncbi:MAG TPA: hypothetical protein VMW56_21470 [Candidatus Margulisiibacteriota bacterium]|nr:hypothetical protein [Candidatus Margulisiibacteriota bacterium]
MRPMVGVDIMFTVAVRTTVGVLTGSVRPMVGVEVMPTVAVRTTVGVLTGSVRLMVGVEVTPTVAVRTMVGVKTGSVRPMVGVEVRLTVAVRAMVDVRVGVAVTCGVVRRTVVGVNVGFAMTVSTSGAETAPGPGLATLMLIEPARVAFPVAISRVDELNVVASGTPFDNTCAPLTKRLPPTVSLNCPSKIGFGLRVVGKGIWLRTVIRHVAELLEFETLVARAVTFQPAGGTAGAVYFPVALMYPTVALPPTTPLTVQITAVLATPFTNALNWRSPPTGTLTDVGDTVTVWALAGAMTVTINRDK